MDYLFIKILIIILVNGSILKHMVMVSINIIKVWDTQDLGKMIFSMVKDSNFGKMVLYSRVNSFRELKFMDNLTGLIKHHILASSIITVCKAKESLYMKMEGIITESGKIIWWMDMANLNGIMDKCSRDTINKIKNVATEFSSLVMVLWYKLNGSKVKYMEKER